MATQSHSSTSLSFFRRMTMAVLTAKEKKEKVWQHLQLRARITGKETQREWPSYKEVLDDIRKSDYSELIQCPHDIHPRAHQGRQKKICPVGMVCCAKLELFSKPEDNSIAAYTGLLAPGTTIQDCIVRLSSALQPANTKNSMVRLVFGKKLKYSPVLGSKSFVGMKSRAETYFVWVKKSVNPRTTFLLTVFALN